MPSPAADDRATTRFAWHTRLAAARKQGMQAAQPRAANAPRPASTASQKGEHRRSLGPNASPEEKALGRLLDQHPQSISGFRRSLLSRPDHEWRLLVSVNKVVGQCRGCKHSVRPEIARHL